LDDEEEILVTTTVEIENMDTKTEKQKGIVYQTKD